MVAMNPNDPESIEHASAVFRTHKQELEAAIRSSIHASWLRLKDVDAVESKFRAFLDRALREFRRDPDEYMLSLDMGRQSPSDQSIDDDASTLNGEEQQIRIAVYIFWSGLLLQQRDHETLDAEFREVIDDSLRGLRDDPDAFGSEFHWTSN